MPAWLDEAAEAGNLDRAAPPKFESAPLYKVLERRNYKPLSEIARIAAP
jgi:hypothetical protein